MGKIGGIAWASTLGLALSLIAGGVTILATTVSPSPAETQVLDTDAGFSMEPWPSADMLSTEFSRQFPPEDAGNITIGLAARWGYIDDPAVAVLAGHWVFNDTATGGEFAGEWHLVWRRIGGDLHGRFTLPADGHGKFAGVWSVSGGRVGGSLWGSWIRVNDTRGYFTGKWNFTSGRDGGALAADWVRLTSDAGGFRGHAVAAPSIDPVNWDGSLHTADGSVKVVRTIRFERGDHILPQTDPQTVAWISTTTVNWDGILFVLRIPRGDPGANVTLRTTQIGFNWTARELPGLHVRKTVDSAGHAIEVMGFAIGLPAHGYARFEIGMRWGNLSSPDGADTPAPDVTSWDGFAQVTSGGLAVERVLSFERGDALLPRDNRVTVVWHSSTTTGWDGLLVVVLVPIGEVNDTYFTLHAGPFTHVFTMKELPGDHVFDAGNGGKVEVRAVRG